MFGGIARYFSQVGLALGVRSGASRVHGAALGAGAQLRRLSGVLPAARAEIVEPDLQFLGLHRVTEPTL